MRAFAKAASAGSTTRGNGSTFSLGLFATMLACAATFLGIGAPAASAAPEAAPAFGYLTTFGSGELSPFSRVRNPIAVDGSGNVFAANESGGTIRVFAPLGASLTTLSPGPYPADIAIDPSTDALYIQDLAVFGSIFRFTSDGNSPPAYSEDAGFTPVAPGEGIAVDPSTNDLLVADGGAEAIRRYDTSGTLVEKIETPSIAPQRIAVAADGSIYVSQESSATVVHLSGSGTLLDEVQDVGAVRALAVNPETSGLVAAADGLLKVFSPAGALLSSAPATHGEETGLAIDGSSGRLYAFAGNAVNAYLPGTQPGVEAPEVSNLASDSATVSAEVDPGAGPPEGSRAHFEYSANGGESWTSTPDEGVERTGTDGPDTIEANLTGLILNTDYLVRVKAANSVAENTSSTTSFSTPEIAPVVETGSAGDRSQTSATLYGTVNPAGLQTTYHFEYGTTNAYGSRMPLETDAPAGNRRAPRSVSKLVSGLQPGTTYHYRLVAENAVGTTNGADRTFTTLVSSELFPPRAYEQVTPVDKGGAEVDSAGGLHIQTAADGSAIAVNTSAASKDSQSALITQNYLSRRGSSDWLEWEQIDPPQDGAPALAESATAGVSEDFEHALVISNRALAPGGIAGGGNLYVKDLVTGGYTFVAGAPGDSAWEALVGLQRNQRIFLGGAPDLSWVVFYSSPLLLPSVTEPAIYRWTRSTGVLSVESLLPDNTVPPFFAVPQPSSNQLIMPSVSSDGQVIGYGLGVAGGAIPVGVYRRESGQTTPVSASKIVGDSTEAQPAYFDGMTADGRYIFFHGPVRLTDDAPPAVNGQELYRYDAATDTLTYLGPTSGTGDKAILGFSGDGQTVYAIDGSGFAANVWRNGQLQPLSSDAPSQETVSANGRYFAWSGEDGAIYLYDTVEDETVCVSCLPNGGAGAGAAMKVSIRSIGNRTSRSLLDDGTVFFYTSTRLLASDHNGTQDVYAYKDGRLDLISPGDEDFDAAFIDASADGSSVFFQTAQGLVGQDVDGNTDVYVARVGGGFASQNPPPPPGSCKGAECAEAGGQPIGSPPVTTAGTANPATPRKKHKAHKKHKSKKHKSKKHKSKKHKGKRHSAGSAAATHSKNLGN